MRGKTVVVCNRDSAARLILLQFLIWVFPAAAAESHSQQIQGALLLPEEKRQNKINWKYTGKGKAKARQHTTHLFTFCMKDVLI